MRPERYPADDPREWLNRARSSLAKARQVQELQSVYLEDLCFDAQQAAEKAIKAVLIYRDQRFPHIHDLARLLALSGIQASLCPIRSYQHQLSPTMRYQHAIQGQVNR